MLSSTQFIAQFFYRVGNIVRFDANYHSPSHTTKRGFWLCQPGFVLVRCDEDGKPVEPAETTFPWGADVERRGRTPAGYGQWLWRNVREGKHPALDAFNAEQRVLYLAYPDAVRAANDRRMEEARAARVAAYTARRAAMTPFERQVSDFDWTYHYADRPRHENYRWEKEILEALEALPEEEGRRVWNTYGPKGHWGGRPPRWASEQVRAA